MASIQDIQELLKPLLSKMDNLQESFNNNLLAIQNNSTRVDELELQMVLKDRKIEQLERKFKEKNLIIFGLEYTDRQDIEGIIVQLIKVQMNISYFDKREIEDIRVFGKKTNNVILKPITLVEFASKRTKKEILLNASKLKGTKIRIEEDFPTRVVKERKLLKPFFHDAKERKLKVLLKYDKLIVNDEVYTSADLITQADEEGITENDRQKSPTNPLTRIKEGPKVSGSNTRPLRNKLFFADSNKRARDRNSSDEGSPSTISNQKMKFQKQIENPINETELEKTPHHSFLLQETQQHRIRP